jgi:ubiquinone biosynthesis protein
MRRVIDLPSLVDELSSSLRRELDFGEEAANLERMAGILANYPRVAVPACHESLSTPRLLVMDEIVGGVPLNQAPAGPERTEATRELMQAYYRQVLEEGFFHADPHPGNLLWADDKIWLLDFGMVGRLDAKTRRQLMLVMLAFVEGDIELLVDVALEMSGADAIDLDRAAYRAELDKVVDRVRGRSIEEIQLVELLNELTAISLRHGVPLPSSFVLVGKALSQIELTVTELAPEIDPFEEARRFFLSSIRRRVFDRIDPQQMFFEVERMRYRVAQISEGLATAVGNRPGKKFEVRFTSSELEHRIVKTGRMVALGLGAGLTWIAATEAYGSERIDPRMGKGLTALGAGLTAWFAAEAARRQK